MKRNSIFNRIILFSVLLLSVSAVTAQDMAKSLQGIWAGSLKVSGMELRLVMNVTFSKADSMVVTLDSPDQGATGIPTSKVIIRNDSLLVYAKSIGGKFFGKPGREMTSIPGSWIQGGMTFPLTFERQEKKVTLNRPQEPEPPFPYRVEEVTFPNVKGGFSLAGTLTVPEKDGRYPVAVMITGSGPQNRDEELFSHKPFWVIADYLTRQGIAVLRYDDRGVGKSGGSFKTATTLDFATDVEAAIDFLKKRTEIDSTRIGLIGHSEGGIIAPVVASQRPDVAFIVLMAGPGLTGEEILILQTGLISKAMNIDEKTIRINEKFSQEMYEVLKKTPDDEKAGQKIHRLYADLDKKYAKDTSYRKKSDEEIAVQIKTMTSPWFRCFLTLDPQDYLTRVKCPVLAINGSLDLQVPPEEDLRAIEKALIFAGNSSYTVEELPGLNHLFQSATTGSPEEYGKIEETISPTALQTIGNWIKNNAVTK